ncbi:uracil-DNA glycosylase [Candidatus Nomurabacteria bacterium]|nr:uracil-DNA glycosylase [Candidatus Nomurabacteria bacterium]
MSDLKAEQLKNIHERWLKDCECELKKVATQGVPGHGNPEAEIVFIGEAPGKDEDKIGQPFVGAAGKFLNEMLLSINLKREDVYITNIVKYRPPGNRDPLPQEVEFCAKWLEEELQTIKPKLIVFLGRHALQHFFPNEKISAVHGKILKKKMKIGDTFFALYHPAAALHNGSMREVLMSDFKKLPKAIEKIS